MTRINLVPPQELSDQHLIAEYRELPRVFGIVRKKLSENREIIIGNEYKMGTGHIIFFYDKLGFLQERLQKIIIECQKRNFNITFQDIINISDIPQKYRKNFILTEKDIQISQKRILEKLSQKPDFYTFYGKKIYKK